MHTPSHPVHHAPAITAFLLAAIPFLAISQTTPPAPSAPPIDFPADAELASAAALRDVLSGKFVRVRLANGSSWRIDYKTNGYAYLDTSEGFRDTGQWRVEDGKLCGEWRRAPSGCNEVRAKGAVLYLKRTNGEVIALSTEP